MDKKEQLEIFPYIGAGRIKFGMQPNEVEAIFGVADSVSMNHLKQRVEFRSFMNIAYSTGDIEGVSHIGFGRQMEGVHFKGINFFLDDENGVLKRIVLADGKPFVYMGFIVLLNLGMTLTGFHDNDISQKAVALFPVGAWDKRISKLRPFL